MTSKSFKVSFGNEVVIIELIENEFSIKDFDAWVRTRFAISAKLGLKYTDEIFLSKSFIVGNRSVTVSVSKEESISHDTSVSLVDTIFMLVYMAIPFMMGAVCVYPSAGVSLEASIACVCWATSYLFVRRLLNPENDGQAALRRFAADSFYGGIAAGASVFAKAYLLTHMVAEM